MVLRGPEWLYPSPMDVAISIGISEEKLWKHCQILLSVLFNDGIATKYDYFLNAMRSTIRASTQGAVSKERLEAVGAWMVGDY